MEEIRWVIRELRAYFFETICQRSNKSQYIKKCNSDGLVGFSILKQIIALVLIAIFLFQINQSNQKFGMNTISEYYLLINHGFLSCENEQINLGRSYDNVNMDVSHCCFTRLTQFNGNGGVIHINVASISINISYSVFHDCSCSFQGGAIYFSSTNSSLRMICANRCSCGESQYYHFAYISAIITNHIDYLSVSYCSDVSPGYYPICLYYGKQSIYRTNSSMNTVIGHSGISIFSPSVFSSSHCTFSNNRASDTICIYFRFQSEIMSYTNIVNNNSPSRYGVICVDGGSPKMHYCIFDNNHDSLFCLYSGSLEVSHSFIAHLEILSVSIAVSIGHNNSFLKRNTYQIPFFKTLHCNADVPAIFQHSRSTYNTNSMIALSIIFQALLLLL